MNPIQAYEAKGLKELYPWQAAALESGADGSNLVYCAPTSGGKTVVAEILMIRKLLATSYQEIATRKKVPAFPSLASAQSSLC